MCCGKPFTRLRDSAITFPGILGFQQRASVAHCAITVGFRKIIERFNVCADCLFARLPHEEIHLFEFVYFHELVVGTRIASSICQNCNTTVLTTSRPYYECETCVDNYLDFLIEAAEHQITPFDLIDPTIVQRATDSASIPPHVSYSDDESTDTE